MNRYSNNFSKDDFKRLGLSKSIIIIANKWYFYQIVFKTLWFIMELFNPLNSTKSNLEL